MGCRRVTARRICFFFLVLVLWATQGLYAKKKPPLHPVNVNTATATELQQVPGIGPATAEKILQARKSYGRFKNVNDLEAIRGIGAKRLEKMRKYLTVGTPIPGHGSVAQGPIAAKATQKKTAGAKAAPATKAPPEASEEEEP